MREQSPTRKELEVVARRLLGSTNDLTNQATGSLKSSAPAVGVLAALIAFLWGRRRGKRRSAYVKVGRRK